MSLLLFVYFMFLHVLFDCFLLLYYNLSLYLTVTSENVFYFTNQHELDSQPHIQIRPFKIKLHLIAFDLTP